MIQEFIDPLHLNIVGDGLSSSVEIDCNIYFPGRQIKDVIPPPVFTKILFGSNPPVTITSVTVVHDFINIVFSSPLAVFDPAVGNVYQLQIQATGLLSR